MSTQEWGGQWICSCGNDFRDDNFCMPSACQWEGIDRPVAPAPAADG